MSMRVLLADGHPVVREGLRSCLPPPDFSIVADVSTGGEAVAAAMRWKPDLVVLDPELHDLSGATVCTRVLERVPDAVVVFFSARADVAAVEAAIDAGARAFLLKDTRREVLVDAIRRAAGGESVVDPRLAAALLAARRTKAPKLTDQELNVLRLAAEGYSNREIGIRLYLSRHTVKEYLSNAMRKLDVGSRVEAVLKASREGLLDAPASPRDRPRTPAAA